MCWKVYLYTADVTAVNRWTIEGPRARLYGSRAKNELCRAPKPVRDGECTDCCPASIHTYFQILLQGRVVSGHSKYPKQPEDNLHTCGWREDYADTASESACRSTLCSAAQSRQLHPATKLWSIPNFSAVYLFHIVSKDSHWEMLTS